MLINLEYIKIVGPAKIKKPLRNYQTLFVKTFEICFLKQCLSGLPRHKTLLERQNFFLDVLEKIQCL